MRSALPLTLLILAACGKDATQPAPLVPELSIVAGDAQSDTVGKTLPTELAARLVDRQSGAPLGGRILNWVVIQGGGSVFAAQTQTAVDGTARQSWTLGPVAGSQKLVARWLNPETGEPVTLDTALALGVPGRAVSFVIGLVGSTQLAVGDTATILYWYRDAHGNRNAPCADGGVGDRVTWTSADSAAVLPLGNATPLVDGWATRVVALAARTPGIDVYGHARSTCAPQDSISGISFLVR
jgi:hypothetical protein